MPSKHKTTLVFRKNHTFATLITESSFKTAAAALWKALSSYGALIIESAPDV